MYDPIIGRFLSPDPYVQMPDFSQNFNRYSYCLNNPLIYTDPSGEFFWAALAIGAILNTSMQAMSGNINSVGDFFLSAGIGSLAGAAAAFGGGAAMSMMNGFGLHGTFVFGMAGASGTGFLGGMAVGAASGFAGGFFGGAGNAWANGAGFGKGMVEGLKASGISGITGGLMGGLIEGIDAYRNGRDFWGGKPWETKTDYSLPRGNLPIHEQADKTVGCTQETLESIAEYKRQPINITDKSKGADFAQLAKEHGFNTKTVMPRTPHSEHVVGAQLRIGNPSAITYNNGGTMHTVGINRIQIQQVPRVLGSGYRMRVLVQVMDPLHSAYQNLSNSLFRSGYIRVVIP